MIGYRFMISSGITFFISWEECLNKLFCRALKLHPIQKPGNGIRGIETLRAAMHSIHRPQNRCKVMQKN